MAAMTTGNVRGSDPSFVSAVPEKSGVDINPCYQCMTCTLGCPAAYKMDLKPHQVIRMVQNGAREEVLGCMAIWQCVSCETCYTRCPNGINIPVMMDTLKAMAVKEKAANRKAMGPVFNRIFLDGIRQNGVLFELGMMMRLKMATRDLFSDTIMGLVMMLKGKLSLRPHHFSGHDNMKNIFRKSEANAD